ncbi:hypothetical protein Esi_0101_0081 [Ectocarpus siliculosus]|uniref:Uncharacterized protein n=1 Tax=Ectocarpus siliculosus TaxID=2880 RepID=D7FGT2_ECTSI|nr:hypothetical protein Esi_0101_0081 [Ectocarpus siliculosus]|eukprot:CBJ28358.1 hypothetical protein Esi_0101_0081 [Ectocarpus siliculosus]
MALDFRENGSGGAATSGVEDASDGPTRLAASIPAGVMIQWMLDCPGFVEKLLANTSGHTLSESDRVNGRVPEAHAMPIPTRRTDGVRQGATYAKHLPWRPEGAERLFHDRRRTGNHWNHDEERLVFLTPAHLFTDAFDFRNQLGAWPLVGLSAPRVRWKDDLGFILEAISVLQKGCRARLATADKVKEDGDGRTAVARHVPD